MKYFEKQALLDEFSYATEGGSVLTYKDVEAILENFDDGTVPVIELSPQEKHDGLKRKYIVLKSDTGDLVENCFVLRPDKDYAAIEALQTYANRTPNRTLGKEIKAWINSILYNS